MLFFFNFSKYESLNIKQLMKYSEDLWWKNLRRGLMIAFWASMLLMILSAVLIAIVQYEHVCIEKKSLLPMLPAINETRTAYGLSPISFDSTNETNVLVNLNIEKPITSFSPPHL